MEDTFTPLKPNIQAFIPVPLEVVNSIFLLHFNRIRIKRAACSLLHPFVFYSI
ncbi:MAG: hypothetical protein QOH51_350 [Acidobacteriota bacterium]|jgi:hypothetical protein|nr:hypothetical protein [Acidobacteriota bacterium]